MCVRQSIEQAREYAQSTDLAVFREEWKGNGERIVVEKDEMFLMKADGSKVPYKPTKSDEQATDWTVDFLEAFQALPLEDPQPLPVHGGRAFEDDARR